MRIAFVHQLPLETYPPATNALGLFAAQPGWEVRAWTSANRKGLPAYEADDMAVRRLDYPGPACGSARRLSGFLRWHLMVARELARWKPDAILSVEPHSALAIWIYYRLFGGAARLFIHHHEYYAPGDFRGAGSRTSRLCHYFEKSDLFNRAEWVSQTNEARLRLMQADCATVTLAKGNVWPNYPPAAWVAAARDARMRTSADRATCGRLKMLYLGSASFEDTFIREAAEWAAAKPNTVTLHICGHNIKADVWAWLESLDAPNITTARKGCAYDKLPALLAGFDVGLVLYKGNTLNFIHNVPNKAVEYLAGGLETWYPPEMVGMSDFQRQHPELPLRMVDWKNPPDAIPERLQTPATNDFPFTCEKATQCLVEAIRWD
jgi:hypothetical protein